MLRSRTSFDKTEWTDTFAYCADASELFSFSSGSVVFQLSMPNEVDNGVYSLCDSNKFFSDYLLFSVNQSGCFIDYPGMYSAFSSDGIIFTVWTEYGRFSIFDTVTSVQSNESFTIEFCWDKSGQVLGSGATMAIFVNGECTAAGNFLIGTDSAEGLSFYALDSKDIYFNLVCYVEDFACYSVVPASLSKKVSQLTEFRFSDDQIAVLGRDAMNLYVDGLGGAASKSKSIKCFGKSQYSIGSCDITGDLYFCSFYDDDYSYGSVSKFDVSMSSISYTIGKLVRPTAISVIQLDGIDYPKGIYYDDESCSGTWIALEDRVIRTDNNLVKQGECLGFSSPNCVCCQNDGSVWVSDYGNNLVKHVSTGFSLLNSIHVDSPLHLSMTVKNELFVYSSSQYTVYKIVSGAILSSVYVGTGVVSMACNPNLGKVIVAYSNGSIKCFDRYLKLERQGSPSSHIDGICVRRGVGQKSIVVVDTHAGAIFLVSIDDLDSVVSSTEFDDSIFFNGGICSTAKSLGVSGRLEGEVSVGFTVGMGAVGVLKTSAFKVGKKTVDLSAGGPVGSYNLLIGSVADEEPTDHQRGTVRSSEV